MSQHDTDQQSEKETEEKSETSSTDQLQSNQQIEPSPLEEKEESRPPRKSETELEPSPSELPKEHLEQASTKPLDNQLAPSPPELSSTEELKDSKPSENQTKPSFSKPEVESVPLEQAEEARSSQRETTLAESELSEYRPAEVPVSKQFQAGVTYVGMDGYIYVQEIKQGTNPPYP